MRSLKKELVSCSSSTLMLVVPVPLLKKQTLFLLQILLLSEDPLGECKPRKDWTYDCTHCLIFPLYNEESELFSTGKAFSFLFFHNSSLWFSTVAQALSKFILYNLALRIIKLVFEHSRLSLHVAGRDVLQERGLRLGPKTSIMMTSINVYLVNLVVMRFQI